jgi:hypothetical protein
MWFLANLGRRQNKGLIKFKQSKAWPPNEYQSLSTNKQKARQTNLDEERVSGPLLWRWRPRFGEETTVAAIGALDLAAHGTGREEPGTGSVLGARDL